MKTFFCSFPSVVLTVSWLCTGLSPTTVTAAPASLKLLAPASYLPANPILVRVEALAANGQRDRNLWDGEVTLSANAGVTLSTNRLILRNGLGSGLVACSGGGDFTLTATLGLLSANRALTTLAGAPVTTIGGTLPGSSTVWSGVVNVTNNLTVPAGHTLTILSNTLVLLNGVASGSGGAGLTVLGRVQSLGTEDRPITFTCANAAQNWGEIRHTNATLSSSLVSLYQHTLFTKACRSSAIGHTSTGPVFRLFNSSNVFENCTLSDHVGKIMYASGSDLVFSNCQLARAIMGPEITASALQFRNGAVMDMFGTPSAPEGTNDNDGIYLWGQQAGQTITLSGSVFAGGHDDAIDTYGATLTVTNCILRDWSNPNEDAKGISCFDGTVTVRRSLIANCFVGVAMKTSSTSSPGRVNLSESTILGVSQGIAAVVKANAPGPIIDFRVTNCIVRAPDAVYTDFGPTNFTIGYCDLSETWPGTGNTAANPWFVDEPASNFHLWAGSPCIDAGDPAGPADADASRADMGFFPFDAAQAAGLFVTITAPLSGATYVAPANVTIDATASSTTGTVARVEFYQGAAKLGEDTAAPYSLTWTNPPAGIYALKTIAIDTTGLSKTSSPVNVTVNGGASPMTNTLIAFGSVWKYLDNGSDQATAWVAPGFNDAAWASGPAQLGYGDSPADETTMVSFGPDPNNKYITTYFRRAFVVNGAGSYTNVSGTLLRDDGGVVYLNGTEVFRSPNMPAGPIAFKTLCGSPNGENTRDNFSLPPGLLLEDTNVLAVEIHQAALNSSDISFDLELHGVAPPQLAARPLVSLTAPVEGSIYGAPASFSLAALASDADGTVTNVAFFANGARLGDTTISPYTYAWNNVAAGSYALTAVATDNAGQATTSAVVNVTVSTNVAAPVVFAKTPAPGPLTNLTAINVVFSKPVAGVNAGDLLINGVPATGLSGSGSNYLFTFTQPAAGTIPVTWAATHGIADLFIPSHPFATNSAGANWQYVLQDASSPIVTQVVPVPGSTVSSLTSVAVRFSETVTGVNGSDLLVNGIPATGVAGSGAGPYTFSFSQPAQGLVSFSWAAGHGIQDVTANPLVAVPWSVTLEAGSFPVVISEIMYHPASENVLDEWIEIFNKGASPLDLNGWRLSGGVQYGFSNVTLAAGNYLVIAADKARFSANFPTVTNVAGDWVGFLNNSSEQIRLEDAVGRTVDSVRYADEGDWGLRQRGVNDGGFRGWEWYAAHDGLGATLELINPELSNNQGQNWAASRATNGTPGRANSVLTNNVAPLILEARHTPIVPRSSDPVLITARLVDEAPGGVSASVFYRVSVATPPPFGSVPLRDDGMNGDASAGDGVYSAVLPAQPNGTVIEFYLGATDVFGAMRTWPAPAIAAPDGAGPTGQVANALYQVDDSTYNPTNSQPLYKLIMTEAERAELQSIPGVSSSEGPNAQMNGTFLSLDAGGTELRYLCSFRNRGHGSRTANPPNYHVTFRSDDPWKGVTGLNLNSRFVHLQHVGSVLSRKAGVAGAESIPVQVRVNNQNRANSGSPMFGSYAANEDIGGDWAAKHFPDDGNGNVYRVVRDIAPPDFNYRGEDQNSYTNTYFKQSNISDDIWTDLIGMLRVAGINNATSFTTETVGQVVNVEQWMKHLALMNIMGNNESGLNTGFNDDYFLYAGINDPRFILSYWDLDTILGGGDSPMSPTVGIYTATANNGSGLAMDRFLRWPDFQPIYLRTLKELLETVFAQSNFNATVDQALGEYAGPSIAGIKSWMDQRRAFLLTQVLTNVPPASNAPVAIVTGAPRSPTPLTGASLSVSGAGVVSYRFKLNNGPYGAETAVASPINLAGLAAGTNSLSVIGKSSLGVWQDPTNATVRVWVVNPSWPGVRLNEILARNDTAVNHSGTFPDLVELFNETGASVDLSGLRLTDDPLNPDKFTFPAGTTLGAGSYLVVYATNPDGTAGLHLGFSFDQNGESLYLFDRLAAGSIVLDSVSFGLQLPDLSIGRVAGGDWVLTQPTFGGANAAKALGNSRNLKINEWLALGLTPYPDDFIELFNPEALPVALGGLHLTDQPIGAPKLHTIPALSFLGGAGFQAFVADSHPGQGADHVNFRLAYETGEIGLTAEDGALIDSVLYGSERLGISSGHCPDGSLSVKALNIPTPGAPNACPVTPPAPQLVNLITLSNVWKYDQSGADLGASWRDSSYDDAGWPSGPGVLAMETCNCLPEPIRTTLAVGNNVITYYFRTHFNVGSNLNISQLQLTHLIDDGAVVYLNGAEVHRANMPAGTILFSTQAASAVGDAAFQGPFDIPLAGLLPGDNVLAVEVHQFGTASSDITFGLKLDGAIVTNTPALAGVVINEILANNATLEEPDGSKPDWVEIYNPSLSAVDLADMSLTDDSLVPRRWVFPAGSFIPGLGYLKVRLDPDLGASATNTGFGLKANGGAVYLFHRPADGAAPASAITYGLQAGDWSIGRVPNGSTNIVLTLPTLGAANIAASLGTASALKVNEWMAAPFSGDDWFEIYNPNPQPVDLSGLWVSDDFAAPQKYQLPPRSFIGTGASAYLRLWAANGADADFTGFNLRASGEAVLLSTPSGVLIDGYGFGPQLAGVSQGRLPDGAAAIASFVSTVSPGNPNFLPLGEIVISELLSHSDPPLEDAVELQNIGGEPIDIGGWYLSDSQNNLLKYKIPAGTSIPAGGFAVFYEYQFNYDNPDVPFSFSSARGDEVYLSQASGPGVLTGYRAFAEFGAAENGVSFGRYPTSVGADFTALSARTFGVDNPATTNQFRTGTGKTNAAPKVGPVVINEIMYHQAGTNEALEFIELQNILGTAVALYDPANPQNTWRVRKGVDFNFPPNVSLPAGGFLVLVSFDPLSDPVSLAAFRAAYGTNMTLYGPYRGQLDNGGEAIELQKPDAPQTVPGPDFGFVPYITVDRVVYRDTAPWPASPDGGGDSLKRITASAYGNDPVNWAGGAPNPGAANFAGGANSPPVLASIGNKTVAEGGVLSFTATAADAEAPPQTLTFSLDAGAPGGASITPSGVFTWAPTEAQGPGVYPITVRVSDNGSPVLSDFETIQVTVTEVNTAPVLNPIGAKVGDEGTLITFNATATDVDEPGQTLTYSLDPGAPALASLTPGGVFTWTPGEADGPGVYTITVRVTDNGTPPLNDSETLTITVNEANTAPVLAAIGNKSVQAGSTLSFTATATDPDAPSQTLTFSLDPGFPGGASITAGGAFTWTPGALQGGSNYPVTIRVTDNGSPPLSDLETITINVAPNSIPLVLCGLTNTWKYVDTGANLGTAWKETAYDDSLWPAGAALLYNETATTPAPKNTLLSLTGTNGARIITYYFRTHFDFPADTAGVVLTATNALDDGAIVWLNGVEAARINMPAGAVTSSTLSSTSWEATSFFVTNISAASLVAGDNVLAVEVHQQSATSSDVVFGLSLAALIPMQNPVSIATQPTNQTVTAGAAAQLSVVASGSHPLYQWLKNGSAIPGAKSATYSIPNAQVSDQGAYSVMVSNLVSSMVSSSATLTVNPPANSPPVLNLVGNRTASEGTALTFTATATDPESPPQTLTFTLDAGAPAGATITSGGLFSWTPNEQQGGTTNTITVRVADNGSPALDDFETITIVVNEVNVAPVLNPIGNKVVTEGRLLSFTATASDADQPAQRLTYSLDAGAPAGSLINATNGLFTWTPPPGFTPATNLVTVRVTDNGVAPLSDSETITIVVAGQPRVTRIDLPSAGKVTLEWASVAGKTYRVDYKDSLSAPAWQQLGGTISATGPTSSATDNGAGGGSRFYRVVLID